MKKANATPTDEHVDEHVREAFVSLITPQLRALNRFLHYEIEHLEAAGDLNSGELSAEVAGKTVLANAWRDFVRNPEAHRGDGWLIGLAREYLEARARHPRSERVSTIHLEAHVPETPPAEEVTTLGEEILYFHEPEEYLTVEDIIPDLKAPTPEQELEMQELRSFLNAALAAMPKDWRRALVLRYVEGLQGAALAEALGRPEPEVDRILEEARAALRRKLLESGYELDGG
jgi:RNA polymerase sigma factor (sigma-70 family)